MKYIIEKILEMAIPLIIVIITTFLAGSYLSSNYLISLIINKQYWTLFNVLSITILISIFAIVSCYFCIYILKKKLERYYFSKERCLSYCKFKITVKKEIKKSKISVQDFFSIPKNSDHLSIYSKNSNISFELNLANNSDNTFIEIIFIPILNEKYIKDHIENELLKELSYYCIKEELKKNAGYYDKFKEELYDIISSDEELETDSMLNTIHNAVRYKIKNELFEKIKLRYRVVNEINYMKFDFEENYVADNSELIIKMYFKNKVVDQKTIKLVDILKNEYLNIEFSKEVLKNI